MPDRMQQAAENSKQSAKQPRPQEFSFQPMVNEVKTAADFKKMQDRFANNLAKSKTANSVTRVVPFKAEQGHR